MAWLCPSWVCPSWVCPSWVCLVGVAVVAVIVVAVAVHRRAGGGAEQPRQLLLHALDVPVMLDDQRDRLLDHVPVQGRDVQQRQRPRPVERLADARRFAEVEQSRLTHHSTTLPQQLLADAGHLESQDVELALGGRVAERAGAGSGASAPR